VDLLPAGAGDGGLIHCARCGALAAGPCARCRDPVCGDCVVLTEGGAHVWAICHRCEKKGGRSLRSGWLRVLGWLLWPMLALLLLLIVLQLLFAP
jgi:hypothetical protein